MASGDAVSEERKVLEDFLKLEKWRDLKDELEAKFRYMLRRPCLRAKEFYAWNGSASVPFTDAYCEARDLSQQTPLLDITAIFMTGSEMLGKYIRFSKLPDKDEEVKVLHCLIQYLMDSEDQKAVEMFDPNVGETAYCSVLANHLLTKLGVSVSYLLDRCSQYKPEKCPCTNTCGTSLKDKYGDTSIGNEEVWHGRLDVVLQDTAVLSVADEEITGFPDKEEFVPSTFVETEFKQQILPKPLQQLVAQTVVFAFFKVGKNAKNKNSLIPCIGFNKHKVIIYLYDPVRDIFLEFKPFSLLKDDSISYEGNSIPISVQAIVTLWMVVNHKVLCTGFSYWEEDEIEGVVPKANFYGLAQDKIDIYKHQMKFGNCFITPRKRSAESDWTGVVIHMKKAKSVVKMYA